MKQVGEKHKEYYVRPSLLLFPTEISLKFLLNIAGTLSKSLTYKMLSEYEQIIQVKLK